MFIASHLLIASLLSIASVATTPARAADVPVALATLVSVAEPATPLLVTPPRRGTGSEHEGPELSLHWGTFGVLDAEVLFEGGLEYRFGERSLGGLIDLHPIVGVSLLADGGTYVFAGARHEWNIGSGVFLAPSFAAGVYQDAGVDLGGPLEFRSGLDLGIHVTEHIETAIGFYHLSNGGLYSLNGGSESALFSVAFGL